MKRLIRSKNGGDGGLQDKLGITNSCTQLRRRGIAAIDTRMVPSLPVLLAICFAPVGAFAQQIPQIRLTQVASGLHLPIAVFDDGTGRLLVLEPDRKG
jgi:hypothetical protein